MMNARKGVRPLREKGLFIFGFPRLIAWIKKVQDAFMKSLLAILSILLFLGLDAVAAVASADFEAIVHWRERALPLPIASEQPRSWNARLQSHFASK
jgi:hypothetical protein